MAKLIKVDGNMEVKKADVIVRARYKLNPLSIKFITTLITGLKRGDDINELYQFKVKDFKELTGLKRKDLYWAVKEVLKELLEKPIYIPKGKDENDNSFLMLNWVASAEYKEGEGIVEFEISNKLRPYLLEVQKKFLKYRLENILSLRSAYAIRLYEILKDWFETFSRYNKKAERIISVNELRQMLEIPNSYPYGGSSGIKQRILEKARVELAKHTDITFNYEEIKEGKKVTHLRFFVEVNLKDPSIQEFIKFIKNKYKESDKAIGITTISKSKKKEEKGEKYFLFIDKKGYLYAKDLKSLKKEYLTKQKSLEIFKELYQISKISKNYFEMLKKGEDFKEKIKDKEFLENFIQAIKKIKQS